jgi:hypothetical protein
MLTADFATPAAIGLFVVIPLIAYVLNPRQFGTLAAIGYVVFIGLGPARADTILGTVVFVGAFLRLLDIARELSK